MGITFTQQDLDNLKEALVTGLMEITVQGRTVKYRSQADIISLIGDIEASLASGDAESDFVVGGFDKRDIKDEKE